MSLSASLRRRLPAILGAALLCGRCALIGATQPPLASFPGAEGFGASATGGRGGEVYHVTTLADAGPGSFRDAVSRPNRIVVFDVGGVIRLTEDVTVSDHVTIAGQTAPGEGICLYGRSLSLARRSNVILRYLRIRQGMTGEPRRKSLGMDHASNIIVDHCSIEWGRWDNLGITVDSHDITIQWCLIAEAIHPQSFGALVDNVARVTLARNLWMSNESRNPKAKGTIQYINNVVYNWRITGLCGGHSATDRHLDVIGNYFIKGPSSNDHFAGQFFASDHVYQRDNFIDLDRNGLLDGRVARPEEFHPADEEHYTLPTFMPDPTVDPPIAVTIVPAPEAYRQIVAEVGCSIHRDAIDRRLISELQSLGTRGSTLDHADPKGEALAGGLGEVLGGPPPVDTDRDGMPDAWESAHGLDPRDAADASRLDSSGYSHLEAYLHSLTSVAR